MGWAALALMVAMIAVAVMGEGTDLMMVPVCGIWSTLALIGAEVLRRMDAR